MARSKGEEAFIEQEMRRLTTEWAREQIANGGLNFTSAQIAACPYMSLAVAKGVLTKGAPHQLTSGGFGVAAAFLKR